MWGRFNPFFWAFPLKIIKEASSTGKWAGVLESEGPYTNHRSLKVAH